MKNRIRILLVEDEIILAMHMKMELEKCGFDVCEYVTSGEKAITCAKDDSPDVILMDIVLAGEIDGIEAAEKIRELYDIPVIIFVTGFENDDVKERAMKISPLAYLIKPVVVTDIKSIIKSYFSDR